MTILRRGLLVDGTGRAARKADLQFSNGIIRAINVTGSLGDDDVVDVDGLVVAPGFIDCHTHYDAQVLWDPDLTPCSWHGITTVVMGNCGFGIAPTRADGRETIVRTLENVEGMSMEALSAGIEWTFESFPEYLDAIELCRPRLNVATLLGHTPVRLAVMGEDAMERQATDDEIRQMYDVVLSAMNAGAIGFASSRQPAHAGAWGKPVPSRLATLEELYVLAGALTEAGRGILALTRGPDFDVEEIASLAATVTRPATWTALMATSGGPDPFDILDRSTAGPGSVYPQIACRPVVMQATLAEPSPFARIPAFAEVLSAVSGSRSSFYRDADWRKRAADESEIHWHGLWERVFVQESRSHADLIDGPSMAELAADGRHTAVDVMCEIALDDGLDTRFRVVIANDDESAIARLLTDDRSLLGLSDAGAHASQLCDAVFATHLLGYWVRERQALTLEKAIWRLTGQPADVFDIANRSRIAVGMHADLVAFDPATISDAPLRRVHDLPAGADRLVADSTGSSTSGSTVLRYGPRAGPLFVARERFYGERNIRTLTFA